MEPLRRREIVKRLRRLGFEGPQGRGAHQFMQRGPHKMHIPNPHGSVISVGLITRLIRNAGISEEEWERVK